MATATRQPARSGTAPRKSVPRTGGPASTRALRKKVGPVAAGDEEQPLATYNAKRDFSGTAEPAGTLGPRRGDELGFVIQKHWASRLHYDFRLELDGVMVSWAVPKGPSYDPSVKQMAIRVEDHPVSYSTFEGDIPKGHYGAGTVIVWDRGTWEPIGDPRKGLADGKLVFRLHGEKLAGLWELVRIAKPGEKKQDPWLLLKKRGDAWARPLAQYNVITALPDSVVDKPLRPVEVRAPRVSARPAVREEPDLSRAVKARIPQTLGAQLASLTSAAPVTGAWVVEHKWDGYRALVRIVGGQARIFTRNGHDWTARLASLAEEIEAIGIDQAWLDGEMVVMNEHGVPDFNQLQNAFDAERTDSIVLFLFDVPFLGDTDLRQVPLRSRRAVLQELLKECPSGRVRFSEELPASPGALLAAACRLGLEGLMLKAADSPYVSRRTETWLKLKCQHRQEFVVVGFTERKGASQEVGSLLLGYHDEDGRLRAAGAVGTGWSAPQGHDLYARLVQLETAKPPVDRDQAAPGRWSRRAPGAQRWITPTMVVEVAFGEWTPDGKVRHAVFRGVRTDKGADAIKREQASPPVPAANATGEDKHKQVPAPPRTAVRVSHPDRVIDASTGLRKIDLIHYYESVADRLLPHLRRRPVSLVRAPRGITGQLFFQKHADAKITGIKELDPALWPGHEPLLTIDSVAGLLSAAQLNVVEFHTWNAKAPRLEKPDRVVFDLDPGEGVSWAHVRDAAALMRTLLEELGLKSWLKTSGGKGLHVVVPLAAKMAYDTVKDFSRAVVAHMARTLPQRFVAKSGGSNRVGKIFIDYLRNGHGQTTAAAFSARARPGLGVSMPLSWDQLAELNSGAQWSIATAREYLSFEKSDPWADYWQARQTLTAARKRLQLPQSKPD